MEGYPPVYKGRIVSRNGFRAYVYSPEGNKKIAESWEDFESCMASGLWYGSPEEATASLSVFKKVPEITVSMVEEPKVESSLKKDEDLKPKARK